MWTVQVSQAYSGEENKVEKCDNVQSCCLSITFSLITTPTAVAIINACHDHALYKPFGGSRRQELPDLSDIMQVIESEHVRVLDLGIIHNHS